MADLVAYVIYDSRLFYPGGTVSRWANGIERNFTFWAREFAPVRSGELVSGISGSVEHPSPRTYEIVIESTAPHSLYVIKGTTGPIWASHYRANGRPGLLRLRPGNGYPTMYRYTVSGQSANNFMAEAADVVAMRHPSLRGFSPTVGFWS